MPSRNPNSFFASMGGTAIRPRSGEVGALAVMKIGSYVLPWLLVALAGVGTEVAHLAWGDSPLSTPFVALAFAASGALLTALMHRLTRSGNKVRHLVYVGNAAAVTLGAVVGLVVGVRGPVLTAWLIGGSTLALATNLRRVVGKSNAEEETEGGGKWGRLEQELKLQKFALTAAAGNGRGTVTAEIKAKDGGTVDDLQRQLPRLGSALQLGTGRMTATVDPEDSSRITVRASAGDLLSGGIPWPGPTAPGHSIAAAPILFGRYEDGEDVLANVVGLPMDLVPLENIEHVLAAGMTGAGKSLSLRVPIADILTRREVSVWAVDLSKGLQTFGPLVHGLDWLITEEAKAKQFFKILTNVIRARTNYLSERGMAKWESGCGLNFLVVWMEEAADYASDSTEYDRILRTARSAGIWIVTSLQRATYTNISTDARSNHGASMCFGLKDPGDAVYVLPDSVIEAGALPAWGNRKPGYAYLTGLGTPEERWSVVMRGCAAPAEVLAQVVSAAYRDPCDSVTAAAAGQVYASRTVYAHPVLPGGGPQPPAAAMDRIPVPRQVSGTVLAPPAAPVPPAGPPSEEEIPDMDAEQVAREVAELTEMLTSVAEMDPEPDAPYAQAGLDDPIEDGDPDDPALSFDRDETDRLTTDAAQVELHNQLDAWVRAGRSEFRPQDLRDIWLRVKGDGRRWFYRQRDDLVAAGVIAEADDFGVYLLLRSPFDSPNANAA